VGTMRDYLRSAGMLTNRGTSNGRRLLKAASVDAMFVPRLRIGGAPEEDADFCYGLAIGDAGTKAKETLPAGAGSWGGSANTCFFADPARDGGGADDQCADAAALYRSHL
jgi:CubicO group peptidase (beta-lactamase class C family)